jgi:hypothetical protein
MSNVVSASKRMDTRDIDELTTASEYCAQKIGGNENYYKDRQEALQASDDDMNSRLTAWLSRGIHFRAVATHSTSQVVFASDMLGKYFVFVEYGAPYFTWSVWRMEDTERVAGLKGESPQILFPMTMGQQYHMLPFSGIYSPSGTVETTFVEAWNV